MPRHTVLTVLFFLVLCASACKAAGQPNGIITYKPSIPAGTQVSNVTITSGTNIVTSGTVTAHRGNFDQLHATSATIGRLRVTTETAHDITVDDIRGTSATFDNLNFTTATGTLTTATAVKFKLLPGTHTTMTPGTFYNGSAQQTIDPSLTADYPWTGSHNFSLGTIKHFIAGSTEAPGIITLDPTNHNYVIGGRIFAFASPYSITSFAVLEILGLDLAGGINHRLIHADSGGAGSDVFAVENNGLIATSSTLRISGGSPTAGKVLTATDSIGNSVWSSGVTSTTIATSEPITNTAGTIGFDYNFSGTFIAPQNFDTGAGVDPPIQAVSPDTTAIVGQSTGEDGVDGISIGTGGTGVLGFGERGIVGNSSIANGIGVYGEASAPARYSFKGANSNSGTENYYVLSATGKIATSATLEINGGSPSNGKVLTATDSFGNAVWSVIVTPTPVPTGTPSPTPTATPTPFALSQGNGNQIVTGGSYNGSAAKVIDDDWSTITAKATFGQLAVGNTWSGFNNFSDGLSASAVTAPGGIAAKLVPSSALNTLRLLVGVNSALNETFSVYPTGQLKTSNTLTIQGGSPASGKVWTASDSAGNGSWVTNGGASAITALTGGVTASGPGSAVATVHLNAGATITGTLPDGNLSSNVALLNGGNDFTGIFNAFANGIASNTVGDLTGPGDSYVGYDGTNAFLGSSDYGAALVSSDFPANTGYVCTSADANGKVKWVATLSATAGGTGQAYGAVTDFTGASNASIVLTGAVSAPVTYMTEHGVTMTVSKGINLMRSGSVVGIAVSYDSTAVTLTPVLKMQVRINGTQAIITGALTTTVANNYHPAPTTQAIGTSTFSAGDQMQMNVENTGGLGNNITVTNVIITAEVVYN